MTRGERIKAEMDRKNIDVKELAVAADISTPYLYNILSDRITNPAISTLKLIAKKLEVSLDYLEEGVDQEKLYLDEPRIFEHLPKDLQDFISNKSNKPYLVIAKQLSRYNPEDITESDIELIKDWLRMAINKG